MVFPKDFFEEVNKKKWTDDKKTCKITQHAKSQGEWICFHNYLHESILYEKLHLESKYLVKNNGIYFADERKKSI